MPDDGTGTEILNLGQDFPPVDPRHEHIQRDHVRVQGPGHLEALRTVGGHGDPETFLGEHPGQGIPHGEIVIDHQNGASMSR